MAATPPNASPKTSSPKGTRGTSFVPTYVRPWKHTSSIAKPLIESACIWFGTKCSRFGETSQESCRPRSCRLSLPSMGLSSRQVGSHLILETEHPSHQRIAVPAHEFLRIGTLGAILRTVAGHKQVSRQTILDTL